MSLRVRMTELFLSLFDAFVDGLGDAFGWIVVAILVFIADTYRRIRSNSDRIERLDRHITGDDDDPSRPGLLKEVHDTRAKVEEMSDEMKRNHERTDAKLDQLLDKNNE